MNIVRITEKNFYEVARLMKKALVSAPGENLSVLDYQRLLLTDSYRPLFTGYAIEEEGNIICANWFDLIPDWTFFKDNTSALSSFFKKMGTPQIFWERMVITHPDYQGKGYATRLRTHSINEIKFPDSNSIFGCQIRADNLASIASSKKLGYRPTRIRTEGVFENFFLKCTST